MNSPDARLISFSDLKLGISQIRVFFTFDSFLLPLALKS
jgi:hypothetical protein